MTEPSSETPPPRTRDPGSTWVAVLGLALVVGVVLVAVILWPGNPRTGDDESDDTEPGSQAPPVLIATDEGEALLADIFDHQLERMFERRNRHAKESARTLENHTVQSEGQRRIIREASEALTREGQRLPIGPERTALLDGAVKLNLGPELTPSERLVVQKHDRIAGAALKLTRNGAVPLSALQKQHADERAVLADKMKQRGARLAEQARTLQQILEATRETEDFDGAIVALSHAIQRDRTFAEALAVRGALQLVAKGEYGRAIVDCDNALRVDANNAGALLIRSFGFSQRGSPGAAQADFQQAIRLEPHFSRHRVVFRVIESFL